MTKPFSELGLSNAALKAVDKLGYIDPTPVQEQAIPLVLEGHDVCAAAATGTGKTAAFLLPTLSTLGHAVHKDKKLSGPLMLVVTPTRELAQQIGEVCSTISHQTKHRQCTVYGGSKYGPQIRKLNSGADILIATPGRLNDLVERGVADLSDIDVLVIDEADRLLDMGFWPSMMQIIAQTPKNRQTLLFSATLDRKVMNSVKPILKDPVMVEIAHRGETAKTVEQYIIPVANKKKQQLLETILDEKGADRVIVFCRTKNRTEECMEHLREAGFAAESIHSNKTQGKRKRALAKFADGEVNILVATDVLARGIDVDSVDYVVNFDLPDMAEDYVHRIGRTGRAGERGFAVSFVTRESRSTLRDIEKLIGRDIPLMRLETYEPDLSILEAGKNAKKGKKSKKARPRDIERARAHNEEQQERAIRKNYRKSADQPVDPRAARAESEDEFLTEFNGLGGWGTQGRTAKYARGKRTDREDERTDARDGERAGKRGRGNGEGFAKFRDDAKGSKKHGKKHDGKKKHGAKGDRAHEGKGRERRFDDRDFAYASDGDVRGRRNGGGRGGKRPYRTSGMQQGNRNANRRRSGGRNHRNDGWNDGPARGRSNGRNHGANGKKAYAGNRSNGSRNHTDNRGGHRGGSQRFASSNRGGRRR